MGARNLNTRTKSRTKFWHGAGAERERNSGSCEGRGETAYTAYRAARRGGREAHPDQGGMSQAEFARAFCINPRTLQEWEQGRAKADATSRAYLAVIAKNREVVLDALAS